MENASQALLIVTGVLVGILILSLGAYLYSEFGDTYDKVEQITEESEIRQFNQKFLQYHGRTDLTIQDIITIKHMAEDNNSKQPGHVQGVSKAGDYNDFIDVYNVSNALIKPSSRFYILWKSDSDMLNNELTKGSKMYTCEVTINDFTGKVNKIICYPTK